MEGSSLDGNSGRFYTNHYIEMVARLDVLQDMQWPDWWNTSTFGATNLNDGACCEWDGWEDISANGTHNYGTTVHNYLDGDNGCGHWCVGVDTFVTPDTNYHRFAWRVTAVLGQGYTLCSYYENVPFSSGLQVSNCVNMDGANAGQAIDGSHAATTPIFLMGPGGNNVNLANDAILWIQSIKIYACPAWTADQRNIGGAQACFSQNGVQNP
jgi:hypothetical protein